MKKVFLVFILLTMSDKLCFDSVHQRFGHDISLFQM